MKTLLLTLGLMAACARAGYAVEYVTLLQGEEVTVSPTSTIEVVRKDNYSYPIATLNRDMPNNPGNRDFDLSGGPVVGAVKVRNSATQAWSYVTLKITHANELNAVAPTSLLVIPENSTGNYNIVVETSSDTATWTPFHSQTVSANDAKRFFRTRIVKAE
jgi:hypothetical protein